MAEIEEEESYQPEGGGTFGEAVISRMEPENKAVSEKFRWAPKPDITTYELAVTLNVIVGALMRRPNWEIRGVFDNLPPEARRHFSIDEKALATNQGDEGSKSSDDATP